MVGDRGRGVLDEDGFAEDGVEGVGKKKGAIWAKNS